MAFSSNRRRRVGLNAFLQRRLRSENLEARMLLAGDMQAAWQNSVDCNDVNQDGYVTPMDALAVITALNTRGAGPLPVAAAGEPGSNAAPVAMPDVNGDGFLSAADAAAVIERLNGEGEGELARFRLEATDTDGNVITSVNVGDSFLLKVYNQDLRAEADATGLFAGYLDIEYDSTLVSVPTSGALTFNSDFPNGTSGDTSVPGVIDEAGAFINAFSGFGTTEKELFTVSMTATKAGTVTFTSNPADESPSHDTLFFGSGNGVASSDILYDSVQLNVVDNSGSPDLVQYAKDLAAAGVQLWTTNNLSTVSVQQRDLFADGVSFLPMQQVFNTDGSVTTAAQGANVTQTNTWIFPDGTRSEGQVLSLQEISQRSGVALPTATAPFIAELPDVTLTADSPLNIALNGYDAAGQPLTYTVESDNPDLQVSVLSGNRFWELDVEGYGTMKFQFFEQRAGRATDRFVELTEDNFYNGILFHRIINNFVIQAGDPTATGSGGSDLPDFDDQFHVELQHNQPGILSMAKAGDDSNNSQFFVTEVPTPHLDFNHTVFGRLVEGEEVLKALTDVPTGSRDRPVEDAVICEARVTNDTEDGVLLLKTTATSGSGTVTVTVEDSQGRTSTESFDVNVEQDTRNSHPFLHDIPAMTVLPGVTHQFQLEHTDIEGDDVFYRASAVTSGVTTSVTSGGLVSVQAPSSASAGDVIEIRVSVSGSPSASAPSDAQVVRMTVGEVTSTLTDDAFTVDEDSTANSLDVLDNDTLAASAQIVSAAGADANGTLTISDDGQQILYTPNANFFGEASFDYVVQDADGTKTAKVTVTVNNVLDPPTANDDNFPADFPADSVGRQQLVEDATNRITLPALSNDINVDGALQELTLFDSVTQPQSGTVEFNAAAIFYRPAPDFFGTETFTYTTRGQTSDQTSTGTITITVPEINDAPIAANDNLTVENGGTRTLAASTILANDKAGPDNESDQTLTITTASTSGSGTVTVDDNGNIAYTPADDFVGTETITYTVTDNGTDRGQAAPRNATAQIEVTVQAATGGPTANDDSFTVTGTELLNVLPNDQVEPGGVALAVQSVTQPANGTAEVVAFGAGIRYQPDAGFTGVDTFTYTIVGESGKTSTATVTVTVESENQPPVANADALDAHRNGGEQALDVLGNDTTQDGETLTIAAITVAPNSGTATINAAGDRILYTPNADFAGTDTLTYRISDGNGGEDTATVTITVSNRPPTASDDSLSVDENGGGQELNVLANDSTTPDTGETLTVDAIVTQPTNGTATINSANNRIVYTPNANFSGSDTLTYRISDGNGGTDTATVNITVTAEPTNNPPTAFNDDLTVTGVTQHELNVLVNDTALPDSGETLTIAAIVTGPQNGTATINAAGDRILYTPNASSTSDTLTYRISDGNGGTATATVDITVIPGQDAPDAVNDAFSIEAGATERFSVLANDTAANGETLTLSAITAGPANGTALIVDSVIEYTPAGGFVGTDTLTYRVSDGAGRTDTATVTFTVTANNPVSATNDQFSVNEIGQQELDVLANDTGDGLKIVALGGGTNGVVAINSAGTGLLYTADFAQLGADQFTYTIEDADGQRSEATVTVNVSRPANESFFEGSVFMDSNGDGVRNNGEVAIGGVLITLAGTDADGNSVRRETRSAKNGSYRFDNIAEGSYTVTQEQPLFMTSGTNMQGVTATQSDSLQLEVSSQLVASSGNIFTEQGMSPRVALLMASSSWRAPGLTVVMDGDQLQWYTERGGWEDVQSLDIKRVGDTLEITADGNTQTLSILDKSRVRMIGIQGNQMLYQIVGTSQDVMGTT